MKFNAIYTRISVSTIKKSEGESLKSQQHRCRERLNTLKVPSTSILHFEDDGYSGGNLKRPQMQGLLTMAKAGRLERVVVTEMSRLSRDTYESQQLIKLFAEHEIELVMLDFEQDLTTATGRFWLNLKSVLNTHERELVIERTKKASYSRAKRGLWDGVTPLGYKRDPVHPGRLEVDERGSEVIKLIFRSYLSFGSVRLVQEKLAELGIYRPERLNHKGEVIPPLPFPDSTLRQILTSRVYIGEREYQSANKEKDQERLDLSERYQVFQGHWEPIIERAEWERVQERLAFNAARRGSSAHIKHKVFILSGLLVCGECKALLNTDSAKKNTYFYYCHQDKKAPCSVKRWPAKSLEIPFLKALVELYRTQGVLERACLLVKETQRAERECTPQKARQLENHIKQLKHEQAQIFAAIKEQPSLTMVYHNQITQNARSLQHRAQELELLRKELKAPVANDDETQTLSLLFEQELERLFELDSYLLRQLLMYTVSRVEVFGRDELRLILRETPLLSKSVG